MAFARSLIFGRGGGLFGAKRTVTRSEIYAAIHAFRYAPQKTPLVLISDHEYFVSTAQSVSGSAMLRDDANMKRMETSNNGKIRNDKNYKQMTTIILRNN